MGRELVESFVPSFAPRPSHRALARIRARYHYLVQAGYTGLFMLPWNRRRYTLPSPLPGIAILLAQAPLVAAVEVARHVSPAVDRRWQAAKYRRWERWTQWQAADASAAFDAGRALRR